MLELALWGATAIIKREENQHNIYFPFHIKQDEMGPMINILVLKRTSTLNVLYRYHLTTCRVWLFLIVDTLCNEMTCHQRLRLSSQKCGDTR